MKEGTLLQNIQKFKRIIREYYELSGNNLDNLHEMEKFLERYKLMKGTWEGIENPNGHYHVKKSN